MVDDTPVSSTVTTGAIRTGAVSTGEPEPQGVDTRSALEPVSAPPAPSPEPPDLASPPSAPSALFEPTSEEEELAVDSGWADAPAAPSVGHLELAAPEPTRLLYEKALEPSDESPILYCERVYVVDSLQSDQELGDHLLQELEAIRQSWRARDSSQFVQLASFDHAFEAEPKFPPLATLSWKDWQGRTELWVRGVRRSGPPPSPPPEADHGVSHVVSAPPEDAHLEQQEEEEHEEEQAATSSGEAPRLDDASPVVSEARTPRAGDSGTSWQSPARSGEYPIPNVEDTSSPPPSSQRLLAGEELIGALFERMNELSYLPDMATGAGYVLETLEDFIPCSGIAIHVLDPVARELVLVRALGPQAAERLGTRQPASDSSLGAALRQSRALRGADAGGRIWALLGVEVAHSVCAPVRHRDRVYGAIDLGRSAADDDFSDGQVEALEFISEQFAEFLAERPFSLQPET